MDLEIDESMTWDELPNDTSTIDAESIDVLDIADAPGAYAIDAESTDEPLMLEVEGDASICPVCGDPLTWHEQACATSTGAAVADKPLVQPLSRAASLYAYSLGQVVQPVASVSGQVVWRGQLKERSPETGFVLRVPVYQLNNGFWDCYREEELQAA